MACCGIRLAIFLVQLYTLALCSEDRYPNPLLFTKFNGNLKDLTGRNADPSIVGQISYVNGPFGETDGGVYLDGSSYIQWTNGDGGPLDFRDEYTIMFWIMNDGDSKGALFTYYDIVGDLTSFELWEWSEENSFYLRHTYGSWQHNSITVLNSFVTGGWVHIAVTYSRTTGYNRLYRDGIETWRRTWTHDEMRSDTDSVRMGQRRVGNDQIFKGAFSCLQVYDVFMSYREISKVAALCQPDYAALKPWPRAMGLWPLNRRFGTKDMKPGETNNHAEIFGSLWNIGPGGDFTGSYELRGSSASYLEINNADNRVGPLNSLTYSIWFYPTNDNLQYPLLNYEYGTEQGGTQNWALHIWALPDLYICTKSSPCGRSGSFKPYQWNHAVVSFDFSADEVKTLTNDEENTFSLANSGNEVYSQLADGIRIGKTFYAPDERYMNARIACAQLYDMPMSFLEMRQLASKCDRLEEELDGVSSGLVLMYPFNKQSKCSSVTPVKLQHRLENADCILSTYGPRKRGSEAIVLSNSGINGDRALLKPTTNNENLHEESSFTLMFYIKLDMTNEVSAKIGFLQSDDTTSETWLTLSTNGEMTFKAGGLSTTDDSELTIESAYNQQEVDWVHIAVSCNRLSARCYIFRNASYIGESLEDTEKEWFVSTSLFVELTSAEQGASVELGCLQLYSRDLSQGEIITTRDRCTQKGDRSRPPLPVGFWPLDKIYKSREITGRSRDIEWTGDIIYNDDSPFSSSQGSMFRSQEGVNGLINSSPGTDTRHSMSLQVYMRSHSTVTFPFFAYKTPDFDSIGLRSFVTYSTGSGILSLHTRLIGINGNYALQANYIRDAIPHDEWVRMAFTYDYSTSTLKTYVNGNLMHDYRLLDGIELFTTANVNIGHIYDENYSQGVFGMTCVQLYNTALTVEQLDNAAKLCHYQTNGNTHFQRPPELLSGYTQSSSNINTTITVRNRLECLQSCSESTDCLAVNYFTDNQCHLTSVTFSDTGVGSFENTGGVYVERVHPLLAEAL